MPQPLKSLAAALVAALLTAGLLVPTASATFHSSTEHPAFSVSQAETEPVTFDDAMEFAAVSCSTFTSAETWTTKTSTNFSFKPHVTNCKDAFGRAAHVSMNECRYVLHSSAGSGSTFTGTMGIECPVGKSITTQITTVAGTCTVTIPSQTGLATMHYENTATDVKAKFQVKKIKSSTLGGVFACGVFNGEHSTGELTGSVTITAKATSGEAAAVSVSAG